VPVLAQVPRPVGDATVVPLDHVTAGGLEAVQAEWSVDGGAVVLTGRVPFADLTGRAGFRSDGTLDGTVTMRARVGLLGLDLGEATWSVEGWAPGTPLAAPEITLRGTALAVDLRPLPAEAAWSANKGVNSARTGQGATIDLPSGVVPPGQPLSPRIVEVYRGLLNVDISALRVHADAHVAGAPAFVTNTDLFFAPGMYGADSPEALRVLDIAVRAALKGLSGPVAGPQPQVVSPAPRGAPAPKADTTPVPANVPAGPPPAEAAATRQAAQADEQAAQGPEAQGGAAQAGTEAEAAQAGAEADSATATGGAESADAAPAAAEGAEGPAAGAEAAPPPVELIMPEPPTELSSAAQARGGVVTAAAGGAGRSARKLPSADADVSDSRAAVPEPAAETSARAREELAAELGDRPAPSPEIVALCDRIRTAIRENRPEDEDQLLETDPTQQAQAAGATVTSSVQGQVDEVGGSYNAMASPPAGTPTRTATQIQEPSPTSEGIGADAASAAPDPIPPENTTLDADVAATDERITQSGIDKRVTREIPDGPFAASRDARGQLGEVAQKTPQQIQAEQQQAIDSAQADMAQLQLQAVAAMRTTRSGTVSGVGSQQTGMIASEGQTRESVSRHAQQIYDDAQRQVDQLLQPLSRTAIARWEAGLTRLSQDFHDSLARVKSWIDDRHSGVGGKILAIGDYIGGLPDWVTDEYNRAERQFGDGVCDLLTSISSDVNGVIAAAKAIIQHARDDIDAVFKAMEDQFPEWAAQERARFGGMLDSLDQRVTQAQTSFVRDVSQRAITAVNQVHAEAQALRDEAGGLIGRVVAAIEEFIDDPIRAIINGLLRLVGIPPSAFWALIARIEQVIANIADDPENFINNLVEGVKQGFQQFFDNFGKHVLEGFWNWLFSGLETPIPMPRDLSATSLFTFALQLMGITWARVREILVRHIGPTAVEVIDAAWQLISVLIERGPEGLVDLIKEQLSPENIVNTILEAAVQYLMETLIQQVIVRVIGLLNPVGAIIEAIDLIYQVCSWIFRNAARIFRFVEAVVNGMADVIAGNVSGLATKVEQALASLIPPVIDFLAGLLHLGGLPGEVAQVIIRLQTMVYAILDRVIGFLAERGRALLARIGIGTQQDPAGGHNKDEELGTTVRFTAGHESHRLWFEISGEDATLMVASVPEDISRKIAEWRARLDDEIPESQRADTTTKLDHLAAMADEANTEGDTLARQFLAARKDPNHEAPPPDDNALEARERAIAGLLAELFEAFDDEARTRQWLADMASYLPGEADVAMDAPYRDWALRIPDFTIGNEPGAERIWPVGTLDGTRTGAEAYIATESTHRLLLPYFQAAPGKRSVQTEAFSDYVFFSGDQQVVRRNFRTRYGNDAVTKLKSTAAETVASTRPDEYKQALLTRINRMAFVWDAPGGGRIEFPTERIPDHTRYRPEAVDETEANGIRTVRYRTVAGQEFVATIDSNNGLTMEVTGFNLSFMTGRGVTEDSPAFTAGNGFDRSHIIANEFGGSGFAVGGNLVTASAYYNQQIMRGAERRIGNSISAVAQQSGRTETQVSFTMTVQVTFGALRDPAALAQAKALPGFPADRVGTNLDAEILQKIHAGTVHPDLMRITGVVYTWTFIDPPGPGSTTTIGPDLWLLTFG
jgi:hypothetical protein